MSPHSARAHQLAKRDRRLAMRILAMRAARELAALRESRSAFGSALTLP